MPFTTTTKRTLFAALAVILWLLFMLVGDGLAVLATLIGSAVTLISVPVLWLSGKRRGAGRLLAGLGICWACYLAVSTGIVLLSPRLEHPLAIGQEVCADSGCFVVEKVDKTTAGPETAYTLYWHLSSTDKERPQHFPGKGLELYMFDERGRKFALPSTANQDLLDITLPAGETVRQSMTFSVPADARELFLTARYRPFTFQSLFPGELSLVHRHFKMIRIQ